MPDTTILSTSCVMHFLKHPYKAGPISIVILWRGQGTERSGDFPKVAQVVCHQSHASHQALPLLHSTWLVFEQLADRRRQEEAAYQGEVQVAALSGKATCHLRYQAWGLKSTLPLPQPAHSRSSLPTSSAVLHPRPQGPPAMPLLPTRLSILSPWKQGHDMTHL